MLREERSPLSGVGLKDHAIERRKENSKSDARLKSFSWNWDQVACEDSSKIKGRREAGVTGGRKPYSGPRNYTEVEAIGGGNNGREDGT